MTEFYFKNLKGTYGGKSVSKNAFERVKNGVQIKSVKLFRTKRKKRIKFIRYCDLRIIEFTHFCIQTVFFPSMFEVGGVNQLLKFQEG